MEQNMRYDPDLLNLFLKMIEDESEKIILQLLFTNRDMEEKVDELVKALEQKQND